MTKENSFPAMVFDQYRAWGRTLTKPMLRQIAKIKEETKAITGIADLLQRIKKTGLGVEQEIIDYQKKNMPALI